MIGYLATNHPLVDAFRGRRERRPRREALALNRVFRSAPRLADYVPESDCRAVRGGMDQPISGLAIDSRRVVPGSLFFALPGRMTDGARHIDEAVRRGAVAVVTHRLPVHLPPRVTFLEVADPRALLARVAQRFHGFPDRELGVIGVAGTRGKTGVAHVLHHLLASPTSRVGLLGTVHYDLGARIVPSVRTTPESIDTFGLLAQMRDAGCRQAVLELSAPGIAQRRAEGLQLAAAVLTTLADDPQAHPGFAAAEARRVFNGENGPVPKVAVLNQDDAAVATFAAELRAGGSTRVVTYGEHPSAEVRAEDVSLGADGARFRLVWPGGVLSVESPLVGRCQVGNLLAAVAAAWALGRDPAVFLLRLRSMGAVPGRLERVPLPSGASVLVDYAYTAEALRGTLAEVRAITPGRVIVVFGCAGDRDAARRPAMTRVAQEGADLVVATADNPRSEAVEDIFDAMRAGMTDPRRLLWIADRRRALALALDLARPGDAVVVAGRGHESYQELGDRTVPFDDRQVVRELAALRAQRSG